MDNLWFPDHAEYGKNIGRLVEMHSLTIGITILFEEDTNI